jgi:hypothetical protein
MAAPLLLGALGSAAVAPTLLAASSKIGDLFTPTRISNNSVPSFTLAEDEANLAEQTMQNWYSKKLSDNNLDKFSILKEAVASTYADENQDNLSKLDPAYAHLTPSKYDEEELALQTASENLIKDKEEAFKEASKLTTQEELSRRGLDNFNFKSKSDNEDPNNWMNGLTGLLGLLALGYGGYRLGKKL